MTTQIVNLFDPITGLSTGTYEAHASPMEPGKFIAPDHSTPKQLPVLAASEAAVFDAQLDAWAVVPDFRGQTFYDQMTGAPVVIEVHGPVAATLAATKPAPMLLDEAKAGRIKYIETEYSSRAFVDIAYMGTLFQADEDSQKLIARVLTALGGASPAGFGYYDLYNTKVPMTSAELQGLAGAILLRNQPLFERRQAKKEAIRAVQLSATAIADVEVITW